MAVKKAGGIDAFANIAAVNAVESAAGTPTYLRFNFPYSILDKMGLIISRIEYTIAGATLLEMTASGDSITCGLTAGNTIPSLSDLSNPLVVDIQTVTRIDFGTAGSAELRDRPYVKDFSMLPGGGILVAPAPLYGVVAATGLANPANTWIKLWYTYKELTTDDYWQLVESRRVISSN